MSDTIQDARRSNFFILDNELVDRFGPAIGAYGLAVYAALVRFAGQKNECWPAHETLARVTNSSVSTVKRALSALAETDPPLIKVTGYAVDERRSSNVYTILPLHQPAAAPQAQPTEAVPLIGLREATVGAVEAATSHGGKLGAIRRTWAMCFGADHAITPSQVQQLVNAANGDYARVADAALSAARVPNIKSAFALVLSGLKGGKQQQTQRRASGTVGYGTVQRADDDSPPF